MAILVLFSYILTFFTHYNLRSDDLNVYVPYISNLISGARLGSQYDYQGFYWSLSLVIKVLNRLFPDNGIFPMGIIVFITTIILFILIYFTFRAIRGWLKVIQAYDRFLFFAVMAYTISQFWYIAYPSYGNTFRRISIIWILLGISAYFRKPNWKTLGLISLSMLALVNFSSTGIFLSFFILYGLAHVFAWMHEKNLWLKLWFLSPAFSIWSVLYRPGFLPVVIAFHGLMLVLWFTKKTELLDQLWIRYHTFVLILVPVVFFFLSTLMPDRFGSYMPWLNFFTNPEFEMLIHYLRFDFAFLRVSLLSIFNIFLWLMMGIALLSLKKVQEPGFKTILYLLLVMFITFFNPFVARFVMTNLTNLAYFRIYDILVNPVTLLVTFTVALNQINQAPFKPILRWTQIAVLVLGILTSDLWIYLDFSGRVDPIYHVTKDELKVFRELKTYLAKEDIKEPIRLISQIYGNHLITDIPFTLINTPRIDSLEELYKQSDDVSKLNQIFYIKTGESIPYTPPYNQTCTLTRKLDVDFVIVEAQYNWDVENGLGYCGEKIFEVGNYRIFRMRYEWLDQ